MFAGDNILKPHFREPYLQPRSPEIRRGGRVPSGSLGSSSRNPHVASAEAPAIHIHGDQICSWGNVRNSARWFNHESNKHMYDIVWRYQNQGKCKCTSAWLRGPTLSRQWTGWKDLKSPTIYLCHLSLHLTLGLRWMEMERQIEWLPTQWMTWDSTCCIPLSFGSLAWCPAAQNLLMSSFFWVFSKCFPLLSQSLKP